MSASIQRANRVTTAIAGLGETFTRDDIQRAANIFGGAISCYIRALVQEGWLTVHARLPSGKKIWRKTAQYQPPALPARAQAASSIKLVAAEARRIRQSDATNVLGLLLKGWSVTHWPPKGYSSGDMA